MPDKDSFEERLNDWIDGSLPEEEKEAFEEELYNTGKLTDAEKTKRLVEILKRFPRETPPKDLPQKIMSKIGDSHVSVSPKRKTKDLLMIVLPIAAAAVLVWLALPFKAPHKKVEKKDLALEDNLAYEVEEESESKKETVEVKKQRKMAAFGGGVKKIKSKTFDQEGIKKNVPLKKPLIPRDFELGGGASAGPKQNKFSRDIRAKELTEKESSTRKKGGIKKEKSKAIEGAPPKLGLAKRMARARSIRRRGAKKKVMAFKWVSCLEVGDIKELKLKEFENKGLKVQKKKIKLDKISIDKSNKSENDVYLIRIYGDVNKVEKAFIEIANKAKSLKPIRIKKEKDTQKDKLFFVEFFVVERKKNE